MGNLSALAAKFKAVTRATLDPIILLIMGYISNLLELLYDQGAPNATVVKAVRIVAFAVREFEDELKNLVEKSDTPYDDTLIDELLEAVDHILEETDDDTSGGD